MNPSVKRLVERVILGPAAGLALRVFESIETRRRGRFRILTYHRVDDARAFEDQLDYLAARHSVVSAADLVAAYQDGKALPPRSLLITFDDADRSFAETAWPLLQRRRLPVTLFVPTGYPDRPERVFWWDRLEDALRRTTRAEVHTPLERLPLGSARERQHAFWILKRRFKRLHHDEILREMEALCGRLDVSPPPSRVLGWDRLRELARQGVAIAPHTRTHLFLDLLDRRAAEDEIVGSLRDLERELGPVPRVFAYPDGRYSRETVDVLREAGFLAAFTTQRGANQLARTPPLELRRVNVGPSASERVLRAQLARAALFPDREREEASHGP
jgi:peptidoglycan/xylan/chitin deacetylase (PgdA/CDA1 family)